MPGPPDVVVTGGSAGNHGDGKKTYIQVCVRVRPLIVTPAKRESPFVTKNAIASPPPSAETPSSTRGTPSSASSHGKRSSRLQSPTNSSVRKIRPPTSYSGVPRAAQANRIPAPIKATKLSTPQKEPQTPPPSRPAEPESPTLMAWNCVSKTTISQSEHTFPDSGRTSTYVLDRVYAPSTRTHCIYTETVRPIVTAAMEGYHGSVFAYGQTSTGKTYTMTGTVDEPGIVPCAVRECFNFIESERNEDREFLLRTSYMEIYNEQIVDLMAPVGATTTPIRIFESRQEGVIVRGLREEVVTSPEQVFALFASGETRRQVGSTNLNKHSSRSHSIFRILIESRERRRIYGDDGSVTTDVCGPVRVSSLNLVDLAGSESVKITGATGSRQKEGQYINKSLMTLGLVVYKLSEVSIRGDGTNAVHIPYRDSKLTRLLQPSLSGNAQICIICNISPQARNLEESHNTLKFAIRAKKIQQRAQVTEVVDERTLLQNYREEIDALKRQLKEAQEAQVHLMEGKPSISSSLMDDDDTKVLVDAIRNLERLILSTAPALSDLTPKKRVEDSFFTAKNNSVNDGDEDDEEEEEEFQIRRMTDPILSPIPVANTPTPSAAIEPKNLIHELHRIQGLLGCVIQKRAGNGSAGAGAGNGGGSKSEATEETSSTATASTFQTPVRDAEMEQLRAQVQKQEVASSLRKADTSFLESQLAEKDKLLQEVSKILDAIEKRQVELENENMTLTTQLRNAMATLANQDRELNALRAGVQYAGGRPVGGIPRFMG